ncbi:MAG TPA: RluA family pseudouridine synthase [Candidatus Tenderia electrophaga]|uniref:RluA family pseudouridine synthase n=1 Tax=Candidatus Tenderia electrophaga TaxID=1748243 RepID=A0A832J675_9GAMM|nr:RluA family pseudouridine synthase [Candidatus Tenderia electrophaga]
MPLITAFAITPQENELPTIFPSPFSATPHAIARRAAVQLQSQLTSQTAWQHDFDSVDGGKMFAVLVVKDGNDRLGFIAAFSGMLAGQWQLPGFAPPVFDQAERQAFLPAGEAELARYASQIESLYNSPERHNLLSQLKRLKQQQDADIQALKQIHKARKLQRREQRNTCQSFTAAEKKELLGKLSFESQQDKREFKQAKTDWQDKAAVFQKKLNEIKNQIAVLKKTRAKLSNSLHQQLFAGYILSNKLGQQKPIRHFFADGNPPSGAGDCAAPKLIHYASQYQLTPLALAEFWWGAAPRQGVRHHGHYYPACRGKCHPILPFMLKGVEVQPAPVLGNIHDHNAPATVYEDDDLVVVNKPSGLLSVPGKEIQDSVLTRLQQRYPNATGPLLVHRLDMSTSGLLLAAKNAKTHKALQHQFEQRSIEKRYVAVLSKKLAEDQHKGTIELPLRVDLDDRPRQLVCFSHGKAAKTHWQVMSRQPATTRIYFYPVTGRTHQLRLHASHPDGLNAAIVGDELYGEAAERLLLHAERLCFTQPNTGERIEVKAAVPF